MDGLLDGLEAGDFDDIPSSDSADPFSDFTDLPPDDQHEPDAFLLPPTEPIMVGFATGGGKKLAPPSAASLLKAKRLLDDSSAADEPPSKKHRSGDEDPSAPLTFVSPLKGSQNATPPQAPPVTSGFMTAGGSGAPPVKADRAAALAIFGEEPPQQLTPRPSVNNRALSGFTTAGGSKPPPVKADRASVLALFGETETASPARPPLRTMTNTFATPKATGFVTPKAVRRIGMGTPRNRASFSTPFKAPGPTPVKTAVVWKSVFDLTPPTERIAMAQFFAGPSQKADLPLLREIDSQNASHHRFEGGLGADQAFQTLKAAGCQLISPKWVQNHWSLLVWKLASQVLAKPSLYESWWAFDEVIRQLKYRYEREYGEAQRPIIRRIQEHDSSASLPMLLCVCHIEPEAEGAYNVELTDGWYRIGACLDVRLSKAIEKGKIRVGRKLAISGAKLSSTEAQSVLEATAKLMISANCCSLARWDAKLGRQPVPFISNLTKLAVDGGNIPLMDVYVDKVFPIAFINAGKGQLNSPWDETEELEKQEEWNEKYQAKLSQLQEEKSKEMDRFKDVTDAIMTYAEGIDCHMRVPPDSLEDDFEDLLEASDLFQRIKSFGDQHLVHLARYAHMRMGKEEAEKQAEVEAELRSACPPRDVRDFRVVRVTDAQTARKEPCRIGMINVWEARALGDEVQEGGRYMVSNLTPGKAGSWEWPVKSEKGSEIYLHTGRGTRWKQL